MQDVDAADFSISGGSTATISAVTQGNTAAVWDVTASGGDLADYNGDVGLALAANQNIQDLTGNTLTDTTPSGENQGYILNNTASAEVTIKKTRRAIKNFSSNRIKKITSQGLGLSGFLSGDGLGGGFRGLFRDSPIGLSLSGDRKRHQGSFSTSLQQLVQSRAKERQRLAAQKAQNRPSGGIPGPSSRSLAIKVPVNLWLKGRWSYTEDDRGGIDEKSDFAVLHLGADYRYSEDLLIGLLGQLDWSKEKSRGLGVEGKGQGWMLGPYLVNRLTDTLTLDLHAAWGESDDKVRPEGTYWDDYDSERWRTELNLTGSFQQGRWHISPAFGWSYFEEKTKSLHRQQRQPYRTAALKKQQHQLRPDSTIPARRRGRSADHAAAGPHRNLRPRIAGNHRC